MRTWLRLGVTQLSDNMENGNPVLPDAMYECMRCGTRVAGAELANLPEPICANCGYRVFKKVRGPTARHLKGQ
jgi:DNA-directed RNA polymerase subunit RPC12/RpoP